MKPEIKVGREHAWVLDLDGAELCMHPGCTVRRYVTSLAWQRKKGAHWRKQEREPIPPCLVNDAPPESNSDPHAEHCAMDACKYGDPKCTMLPRPPPVHQLDAMAERLGATPPAALSPLEVVRDFVKAKSEGLEMRDVSAALATLEESIRADERLRCIADAVWSCACADEAAAGCGCSACRTADRIRSRR